MDLKLNLFPADSPLLDFNDEKQDAAAEFERAKELLRQGLVPTAFRLVEEAKKGNFQAAKFLYPYLPGILNPAEETPDIWEELDAEYEE